MIFRDVGGDNPPRARQLAQEMIVNDNVAIMGGLEFTTTVLGVADVMTEAKMPFVAFNTRDGHRHRQVALSGARQLHELADLCAAWREWALEQGI